MGKEDEITVYPGAAHALHRKPVHAPDHIHGESGIDGTDLLPVPRTSADRSITAVDAMAMSLLSTEPCSAWLVATGGLTNIAAMFMKYPEVVAHIKGLSIMGGAIGGGFTSAPLGKVNGVPRIGNLTPWAEFNIFIDPEAAAMVFDNQELASKTTLIPLDLTHQVLATKEVQELLLYGKNGEKTGKGKTILRTMLVELLVYFAETCR